MLLTINKIKNIEGKKVLVRADFNVPIQNKKIIDDNRIVQSLPTIKKLIKCKAKIILFSHLGKIDFDANKETIKKQKEKNNMFIVYKRLKNFFGKKITFLKTINKKNIIKKVNNLNNGEILLLQNTRYEIGETKNDDELSSFWSSIADIYIMDAFASAHRKHSSTYGVAKKMKEKNKLLAIGFLVEKELKNLNHCISIKKNNRPYIVILGGVKISDKIKLIDFFIDKCDQIIIGGAMAFIFQKALNNKINYSVENDQIEYAKKCLKKAKKKIILPIDVVVTNKFDNWSNKKNININNIPNGYFGMDIGLKTQKLFANKIKKAKTIFWNGPMGVFEKKGFQSGTIAICKAISSLKNAFVVCGGGETVAAIKNSNFENSFSFISTGGGATLKMIENGGHLPCIDIINN